MTATSASVRPAATAATSGWGVRSETGTAVALDVLEMTSRGPVPR
jgi:hypothetical protein